MASTITIRVDLQWDHHYFLVHVACWVVSYARYNSKLRENGLRGWCESLQKCSMITRTVLMVLNELWWEKEGITEQDLLAV